MDPRQIEAVRAFREAQRLVLLPPPGPPPPEVLASAQRWFVLVTVHRKSLEEADRIVGRHWDGRSAAEVEDWRNGVKQEIRRRRTALMSAFWGMAIAFAVQRDAIVRRPTYDEAQAGRARGVSQVRDKRRD